LFFFFVSQFIIEGKAPTPTTRAEQFVPAMDGPFGKAIAIR
jgi:hypothetical protein